MSNPETTSRSYDRGIPPELFYQQKPKPKTPAKPLLPSAEPTPPKESSHGVEEKARASMKVVRDRLKPELGDFSRIDDLHPTLLAIFHSLEPIVDTGQILSEVDNFLEYTPLYNGKERRWDIVPRTTKREARLYRVFTKIFHAIESFEPFKEYVHGQYQDVHSIQINHKLDIPVPHTALYTKPDSIILERDRCMKSCGFKSVRYCHVRTAFDIKTQASAKKQDNSMQLASYARQILAEQPGRAWVPSLIITETQFRFFGFDRSGGWYSSWQDLHENADNFVFAALIMFGCDAVVGNILPLERRGSSLLRKHVNITFVDAQANSEQEGAEKGVCWTTVKPLVYRHTIRGRATMCAEVEDLVMPESLPKKAKTEIEDTPLLIKMYWKADKRSPEWDFLLKARGAAGVGQLIGYGEGDRKISAFRGTHPGIFAHTIDRTACHLLLEQYDGPLCCAPSPDVLLEAVRDAVKGHQYLLFECDILHRDISVNNIVYDGRPGSNSRGRVIDLDLAVDVKKLWSLEHRRTEGDGRTGTKAYLSYKLLVGKTEMLGPHDHMDDLESFFYVLCHLVLTLTGATQRIPNLPVAMQKWDNEDLTIGADGKFSFLEDPSYSIERYGTWFKPHEESVDKMLEAFAKLFLTRVKAVRAATRRSERSKTDYAAKSWTIKERLDLAKTHYAAFIDTLEICLNDIKCRAGSGDVSLHPKDDVSPSRRVARGGLTTIDRDSGAGMKNETHELVNEATSHEEGHVDYELDDGDENKDEDEDEDGEEAERFEPWEDFEEDVFGSLPAVNMSQSSASLHPDMARISLGVRGEKRTSDEGDDAEDDTRRRKKAK